jgi:hypothetical protein
LTTVRHTTEDGPLETGHPACFIDISTSPVLTVITASGPSYRRADGIKVVAVDSRGPKLPGQTPGVGSSPAPSDPPYSPRPPCPLPAARQPWHPDLTYRTLER